MDHGTTRHLLPGFSDPAFDSQRTFRQILKAFSYPCRIVSLEVEMEVPPPLYSTTGAICLTLLDSETPFWMDQTLDSEVGEWLRFHCGCPLVDSPLKARFALISQRFESTLLDQFHIGEDEFPEQSATLLIQVSGFQKGVGRSFTGPGIKTEERLDVHGLPEAFWRFWHRNNSLYPLGVDVILIAPSAIVGLPRTTEVRE